jgi:endonuclease/exonuclease/phosphatase family metal-dependent hydrolase
MQIKNILIISVVLILISGTIAGVQGLRRTDEVNMLRNSLEVITCNIGDLGGYRKLTRDKIVDFFKLCGIPDILLLQEVRNKKWAEYFSNKLGLKYCVFFNDFQSDHGMAILSGLPLLNPDGIYFKTSEYGYGAVSADVMVGDTMKGTRNLKVTRQKIQIVNVHLDRFNQITVKDKNIEVNLRSVLRFAKNEILGDSVRSQSAGELIQWLGKKKADNVILGGDFNSVPFSKAIRIIGSRFDDVLWPSLKYLTGTYKRLNFPVAPRIDFLFLSSNLRCRQASVIPMSPGDHFPVKAIIGV